MRYDKIKFNLQKFAEKVGVINRVRNFVAFKEE